MSSLSNFTKRIMRRSKNKKGRTSENSYKKRKDSEVDVLRLHSSISETVVN